MSQSNFFWYDYIKNNSYINLGDENKFAIIWSCCNAVKHTKFFKCSIQNFATGRLVAKTLIKYNNNSSEEMKNTIDIEFIDQKLILKWWKYRIRRCLVPLNDRDFAKLGGGGTRQRWFLFFQIYIKKIWKKFWSIKFLICYEYINNNLDDGGHIRIVWSCSSNTVKTHNVLYIP